MLDLAAIGVLLVQLGTPDAPETKEVRAFLRAFLSDYRVVDAPRWWWWPLLHGIILSTRPARSAALYRAIWQESGSPLRHYSQRQCQFLSQQLSPVVVRLAMRYGAPSVASVVDEMMTMGVKKLLVWPLFPQYASSTTASVVDAVYRVFQQKRFIPAWRMAAPFYDDAGYIQALAWQHRAVCGEEPPDMHLFSFHGQPLRFAQQGDPYAQQCAETARLLADALHIAADQYLLTFQSRFGREPWHEPATIDTLKALPGRGIKRVVVSCPGFVADCLETLEEIGVANRAAFLAAGGHSYRLASCVNDHPLWLAALEKGVRQELQGWL